MQDNFELTIDNIFPSGEYMVVQPVKGEGQTKSGIILANMGSTGATPTLGTVVRSGEDAAKKYPVGSMVMFRRYSVDEIEVQTSSGLLKLSFVEVEDVIARIDNGK